MSGEMDYVEVVKCSRCEELEEALRKSILWAECVAVKVDKVKHGDLNWSYINEAREALTEDNQEGWSGYVEQPDKLKMMQELEQHKQESKKMCECKDIDVSMWNGIMIRKCKDCGKPIKED